jgi:hypothetical protein
MFSTCDDIAEKSLTPSRYSFTFSLDRLFIVQHLVSSISVIFRTRTSSIICKKKISISIEMRNGWTNTCNNF